MKDLSEYLNFSISDSKSGNFESSSENDNQRFVPGDESADIEELRKIFSGKNLSAKKLRKSAWERT